MGIWVGVFLVASHGFAKGPATPAAAAETPAASAPAPVPKLPPLTQPLTSLPPKFNTTGPSLRLPAILALGLGGLGAGGAVVTGLAAQGSKYELSTCGTQCGGGRAPSDSALSITSAVLSVVAAAGVTTGVILLLTESNRTEKKSLTPRLGLKLSPQRAAASATWKF
jgi:hypothetical protein